MTILIKGTRSRRLYIPINTDKVTIQVGGTLPEFRIIDARGSDWDVTIEPGGIGGAAGGASQLRIDYSEENRDPSINPRPFNVLTELVCRGFDDCVEGDQSFVFEMLQLDEPVKFAVSRDTPDAVFTLVFERTQDASEMLLRGGAWAAFSAATCDEVDAAGSLDPWETEVDAACQFTDPTGDYRCDGQVVQVQCVGRR